MRLSKRAEAGDSTPAPDPHQSPRRALIAVAGSQLLVMTLWLSASAAAPQLEVAWGLSSGQATGLTLAVQIGFVVGAAANAVLLTLGNGDFALAFSLRLATGIALAGVYPSGLKVMAGWFRRGRGMALGVLVGALTVGTAVPHLIRGFGFGWRGVIGGASALAVIGGLVMWAFVSDGPYDTPRQSFSWRHIRSVVANRGVRLSTYGYLGHMWELYAMWTWTAAYLSASALAAGFGDGWVSVATFGVIAAGGLGAWLAGVVADRAGRTIVAGGSMAISGGCALVTPLLFGLSPMLVVPVFVIWGFAVVADSAQFSAMVTETAADSYRERHSPCKQRSDSSSPWSLSAGFRYSRKPGVGGGLSHGSLPAPPSASSRWSSCGVLHTRCAWLTGGDDHSAGYIRPSGQKVK